MAKQTINVGATANDKKGDSLRAAFTKVNANFTELYTALGLNTDGTLSLGAFEFSGSTMSTTDSTPITIDQSVTINSDLTVGGDIVPSIANGSNLGSPAKPFKSLYVSNNTVFLGGVPVSLEAGTNELTINNVPISQTINITDITGQSSFYKPGSIEDYRTGSYYNSTAVPSGSVIIDHATYRWATDSLNSFYRNSAFRPSVYTATIDGSGNITDVQITTAYSYPNPDVYPEFTNLEIVNTDNLVAIDSGIDITDPIAIAASSMFEILGAGVNSIAKPIPADISDLTDTAGLLSVGGNANTGDITFANSIISAGTNDEIRVQGQDADGVSVRLRLEPEYGTAELSAFSGENVNTFTISNADFATGVWQNNGFGIGIVSFTDAQNIGDFFQNTLQNLTPANVTISINGGAAFAWNGGTVGSGTTTPGLSNTPTVPPSPVAITSISFRYRQQSFISVNYDNQEIRLDAQNAGIRMDANNTIQMFGDSDIELQAATTFRIAASEDINIETGSAYAVRVSGGDFVVSVSDDVDIRGADSFRLRNDSAVAPIRIITDDDNNSYTWAFNPNGTVTFPDNTVQTTAWTGLPTYFNGDMSGSVFADDSTLLVDGVNGIVPISELAKSVTQIIDNDATVNTSRNVTTNNSYDSPTDFVADVDPSLGFVIPGLSQRNDTEIEVNLFVEGSGAFTTYLLGLALGRTVIATYSTALGNQTLTSTISQVFSGTTGQVDPVTGWYRIAGRILGTVPAGYTGLVGINFPVYSTESHTWRFGDRGGLILPVGFIIPSDTDKGLVIAGPLTADMIKVDPDDPMSGYNTISNGVNIRTHRIGDDLTRDWTFSWDGTLYAPHDTGASQVGAIEWRVPDLNIANQVRTTRGNLGSGGSEPPGLKLFTYGPDAAITLEAGLGVDAKWHFKDDGSLTIPGDIKSEGNINIDINLSDSTLRRWTFGEDGELTLAGPITNLRTNEQKISLGDLAGETTQGSNAIAIGREAGRTTQGAQAVAIGGLSGLTAQGDSAVAIGVLAGQTSQGASSVAIGNQAGQTTQGPYAVAIGALAGETSQGLYAVAMGYQAGTLNQSQLGVAIGYQAGYGNQGQDSVAIGRMAAQGYQGNNAVAIGLLAGLSYQGANAIAIGAQAGQVNQPANSIVLNASGNQFDPSTTGFFVNPLRNVDGGAFLNYNTTTKEIGYSSDIRSETGFNIDINLSDSTLRRWQFGEDGKLTFPDGANYAGQTVTMPTTTTGVTNSFVWEFSDQIIGSDKITLNWNLLASDTGSFYIGTTHSANGKYLILDGNDQSLSYIAGGVPTNGKLIFGATAGNNAGDVNAIELKAADGDVYVTSTESVKITVDASDSSARVWTFDPTGGITFPDSTVQSTAFTLSPTLNVLKIDDGVHEKYQELADATGTVEHDCSSGHIFYHASPDANWTVNLTNLNLSTGYATTVTIIIDQGGTGYYPNALQIGGSAQTINWQGNATPTPSTNRQDVVSFSILAFAGGYTVLGQLTGF